MAAPVWIGEWEVGELGVGLDGLFFVLFSVGFFLVRLVRYRASRSVVFHCVWWVRLGDASERVKVLRFLGVWPIGSCLKIFAGTMKLIYRAMVYG
jgi:hypothetical protein